MKKNSAIQLQKICIVGALYSAGLSVKEIITVASTLSLRDIRDSKLIFMPSTPKPVEASIASVIGDIEFSDLKKPFACVAVDLKSGQEILLNEGSVATAVSASCCVPPIYRPVILNGMHLIDGAYANPIPASVVKDMGAEVVIGVEVNSTRGMGTSSLSMLDIYLASTRIAMKSTADKGKNLSDVFISPNLDDFKATSIKGADEMIKIGYDACYEKMDEIKELINLSTPHKMLGLEEHKFITKK